jgi:hypothetical protein
MAIGHAKGKRPTTTARLQARGGSDPGTQKGGGMEKMISYCGLNCSECPAFIATVNDDDELRKKTAELWSKEYGGEVKPEDVNCDGCVSGTDRHIGHWHECEMRICGQEKGVENCAFCNEFACEKLSKFFEAVPVARTTLEEIRNARA